MSLDDLRRRAKSERDARWARAWKSRVLVVVYLNGTRWVREGDLHYSNIRSCFPKWPFTEQDLLDEGFEIGQGESREEFERDRFGTAGGRMPDTWFGG